MTEHQSGWWPAEAARDFFSNRWWQLLQRPAKYLSVPKIARLAIILTMSGVCWLGIVCLALGLLQLATR